jgi:hypothetical protein
VKVTTHLHLVPSLIMHGAIPLDKYKIKLPLPVLLTEHHAMKVYWGGGPGTPWIGGWAGLRAGLDTVVRRKIPIPYRDSNP